MAKYLIIILFTSLSLGVFAQEFSPSDQKSLDSLNQIISSQSAHDTLIIRAMLTKANYFYQHDLERTISICKGAKDKSEDVDYGYGMIESYGWLGYLYTEQGDTEKSLHYNKLCLKISREKNDTEAIATALNNIAALYIRTGQIDDALKNHFEVLKIREEMKDSVEIARALNSIGLIYRNQGFTDKALEMYRKSLAIRRQSAGPLDIATSLNNIGVILYHEERYDEAMKYHKEALKLRRQEDYPSGIANSLNNIGLVHADRGELKKAIVAMEEALKIRIDLDEKPGISESNIDLGLVYSKLGQAEKAKEYTERGFTLARKIGYPRLMKNASRLLADVYEQEGDAKKALQYYKVFIQMRDSLNNEETQRATIVREAKYNYEKQKAIDQVESEKERYRQRLITYTSIIGAVLIGIFLIFVIQRLRLSRRQNKIIRDQKTLVEEKNTEILASINYAERIQSAILPSPETIARTFPRSFVYYRPKDIVAGDFYWIDKRGDIAFIAVGDCTGHGVPGALMSVVCHNALNRAIGEFKLLDPGKILDKTRELVLEEFSKQKGSVKDGMDVALCALNGKQLLYAGAYNPLWLVRNDELLEWKADRQPIGPFEKSKPYTTHTIELQQNDVIYLFSDGFADQFGGDRGKKFRASAFKKLLLDLQKDPINEQSLGLNTVFETWRGEIEQVDDVCVVGVQVDLES